MELQTAVVERRPVEAERRFLGRFVYDETRLHDITVRTEGELTRLFVNYTGIPVRKGEHIAEIYSPEFYSPPHAIYSSPNPPQRPDEFRSCTPQTGPPQRGRGPGRCHPRVRPARRKPSPSTARWPVSSRNSGTPGRLADERPAHRPGRRSVSSLWVLLDAYESDIALIHYGQQVQLDVPAFPGDPSPASSPTSLLISTNAPAPSRSGSMCQIPMAGCAPGCSLALPGSAAHSRRRSLRSGVGRQVYLPDASRDHRSRA
jgi:membrane fusion protein, copper/silver efflux system